MSNIMDNRVSTTFTPDELSKLASQRKSLLAIIQPKTVALNEQELKDLSSISVDNFVFVKEAKTVTDEDGVGMLPPAIAAMVPEFVADVTFYEQLDEEEAKLNDLLTRIRHTKRLVAHESYQVANKLYGMYQGLAESGVAGAASRYDKLKARYEGQGGRPSEEKK